MRKAKMVKQQKVKPKRFTTAEKLEKRQTKRKQGPSAKKRQEARKGYQSKAQ